MSTCKNCKDNEQISQQSKDELAFAFAERMVKRLWITTLILIFMLVGTNGAWLWWESQFEEITTTTYEADATDGGNAVINGDGSVNINGESESHND